MDDPSTAQVLAGKYQLVHQLGKGGMGAVWLAHHLTLQSPVAIKLIEPQIAANPEALARFMREARAAAALRSPHVVQILDHGVDGETPYIAMELLEGETLAARLRKVGRLSPADTARILTHTARAVSRAHEVGVVHRDLKPDNIFLIENEEEELAKVLDFGIAKSTIVGFGVSAIAETRTGALMGTLHYMSPEQAEGAKTVDFRTDIWAMGVIAFECLVGRRPFEGETVGTLVLEICTRPLPVPSKLGTVPAGFDAWFARACAREPAARFGSARDAAADLRRICQARGYASDDHEAAREANEGVRTKLVMAERPRRIGKPVIVAGAIAAAAVVAGLGVLLTRPSATPPPAAPVAAPAAVVPEKTPLPAPIAAPPPPPPPVAAKPVAPPPPEPAPAPPPPEAAKPAAPPAASRPHRHVEKPASKPAAKAPASAAPKAPAAPPRNPPPPAEKPKVNLGI
ncbi:MAG TPA: serine/threonine-protein kinase [Polyangia bacterium]|jgi:serine/threonine-protein kinase